MTNLAESKCVPCRGGVDPLSDQAIAGLYPQVMDWNVIEPDGIKRLERSFRFRNFAQALAFTIKVGEIAEAEGHHPLIVTEWGRVNVQWWTHVIKGLHQNDFIMAAKTDMLYNEHGAS
jgi:4a-hydroxytetrahydrobiopterin dehydratase